MISQQILSDFYIKACELELQAFKPGNISIYGDGHGMNINHFKISALESAAYISNPKYSLGEKIYFAVKATREAVGCNTNLGIILLCAPLIEAALKFDRQETFQGYLKSILDNTTIEDAKWVFKAIQIASPAGLGSSNEQDVSNEPSINLTSAMRLASDKDRVALQYSTAFKDVFDFGVLRYNEGFDRWGRMDWAAVLVYTGLLSRYPDSHIERKYGDRYTALVNNRMVALNAALMSCDKPEQLVVSFAKVDREFKLRRINPGTTADLTVATILAALLTDFFNAV